MTHATEVVVLMSVFRLAGIRSDWPGRRLWQTAPLSSFSGAKGRKREHHAPLSCEILLSTVIALCRSQRVLKTQVSKSLNEGGQCELRTPTLLSTCRVLALEHQTTPTINESIISRP